ncbi:unnamed protein product [Hermetia illucens]|uniref:Uncharacterized protein n=1 Tax=Hermetia illucens TaxID=343691 RepID=A0A7R8UAM4_HERIL|nr:unnamed protein product [Hermetia illucens]
MAPNLSIPIVCAAYLGLSQGLKVTKSKANQQSHPATSESSGATPPNQYFSQSQGTTGEQRFRQRATDNWMKPAAPLEYFDY